MCCPIDADAAPDGADLRREAALQAVRLQEELREVGQGADLARHRARDGVVEGEQLPDGRQAAELRRQRAGEVVGVEEELDVEARELADSAIGDLLLPVSISKETLLSLPKAEV